MDEPINFANEVVDGLFVDWYSQLSRLSVKAIVVLGPSLSDNDEKVLLAIHPPKHWPAADAIVNNIAILNQSGMFESSLVGWFPLKDVPPGADGHFGSNWAEQWMATGCQGLMRIIFEVAGDRSFECLLFCGKSRLEPEIQGALVWSVLNIWPKIKSALMQARSVLSVREVQCLRLAFSGLTAVETAQILGCGARTVNFHLSNAMAKLSAKNKVQAILHACWLGAI